MTDLFAIDPLNFVVPIVPTMQQQAERFRQLHSHPHLAERIYFNTLAVLAAQYYLECMGFETDLEASHSCNPVAQSLMDTADLYIKSLGQLECRPVQFGDRHCLIPPEVQQNRLGYLVVQLNLQLREATLLGFCQTASNGVLLLDQLLPLDRLLAHLHGVSVQPSVTQAPMVQPLQLANLSQWLQGKFETGWHQVEEWLTPKTASLAFRSAITTTIKRAQPICLSTPSLAPGMDNYVDGVFVVILQPEADQQLRIKLQIHAIAESLSPGLTLKVIDATGATFAQVSSGVGDRLIQTPQFQGQVSEQFRAIIALNQDTVAIDFVI